ncbi:hypothetical protein BH18ACT4_BH18ACT4_05280 [soil metagenome]
MAHARPERNRAAGSTVWILTDEAYLDQRMPGALVNWLAGRGIEHRVICPERAVIELGDRRGAAPHPLAGFGQRDLVVARSRHPVTLAVLTGAPDAARTLPSSAAVVRVRDKLAVARTLAHCGVPALRTWAVADAALLAQLPPTCFPLVVKPRFGDNARGVATIARPSDLGGQTPAGDLLLAQPYLDSGGIDLKVYVAGDRVWAVLRPSPLNGGAGADESHPVDVPDRLAALARCCRDAFDLELLGLDVLETRSGPFVVDVNEFPNYTGIPEAADAIGEMVLARLRGATS